MQRRPLLESFQSFTARHGLATPVLVEDQDGQHVFVYSNNKNHRYAYSLSWSPTEEHILWVMLNPGTRESEGRRRNTFERCKQWSKSLGFGGLLFGNVFSQRSKSAKELLKLQLGPDPLNDEALVLLSSSAPRTIVAMGKPWCKIEQAGPANCRPQKR